MRYCDRGDYFIGYLPEIDQKSRETAHLAGDRNFPERHATVLHSF
jgi:hypothetical protein